MAPRSRGRHRVVSVGGGILEEKQRLFGIDAAAPGFAKNNEAKREKHVWFRSRPASTYAVSMHRDTSRGGLLRVNSGLRRFPAIPETPDAYRVQASPVSREQATRLLEDALSLSMQPNVGTSRLDMTRLAQSGRGLSGSGLEQTGRLALQSTRDGDDYGARRSMGRNGRETQGSRPGTAESNARRSQAVGRRESDAAPRPPRVPSSKPAPPPDSGPAGMARRARGDSSSRLPPAQPGSTGGLRHATVADAKAAVRHGAGQNVVSLGGRHPGGKLGGGEQRRSRSWLPRPTPSR
mmetsp:Transcript_83420/g.190308  ORF Transcript_83420/g.190308 Transcript_83420/m.190308 type:complete len:293 (+) Transcript_83420:17-895(+)